MKMRMYLSKDEQGYYVVDKCVIMPTEFERAIPTLIGKPVILISGRQVGHITDAKFENGNLIITSEIIDEETKQQLGVSIGVESSRDI